MKEEGAGTGTDPTPSFSFQLFLFSVPVCVVTSRGHDPVADALDPSLKTGVAFGSFFSGTDLAVVKQIFFAYILR